MARLKKESGLTKLIYFFGVSTVVAFSILQLMSLGDGILGKVTEVPIAEELVNIPAPNNLYKTCNNEKVEFQGKFAPESISIDKVGINLPVVSVPLKNGTWQVNAGVANFAEGTSLINTKTGNVGIFAHDRKIGFTNIKNLTEGDTIYVYGTYKKDAGDKGTLLRASYSVESWATTAPKDVNVFYPTDDPKLTLLTCDGTFSQARYVLTAKLVAIEEMNCSI